MQNRHDSILRAVNNTSKSYNILTFPCHESTQSNWATLPHTFYLMIKKGIVKPWNFNYRKLPQNHIILDGTDDQIKDGMQFDIALSQNKFGNFQILDPIARQFNLPLISLEHTLPIPAWTPKYIDSVKQMKGKLNLFISEYSKEKWGWKDDPTSRIIHHGINTDLFKPDETVKKGGYGLACVNDLINRDIFCGYHKWVEMTKGTPNKIIGDTPGLSKGTSSVQELVNEYRSANLLYNSSLVSPIPTVILEAMSVGLPIITLDNCMIPEIVKDGYNGFISNDIGYLREKAALLLKDKDLAAELGKNARETIITKFSLGKHLSKWNEYFDEVYGTGY